MKAVIIASEKSRIAKVIREVNFKNRMTFSVGPRPENWIKEGWTEIGPTWAYNKWNMIALNRILGKRGGILEVAYETGSYSGAGYKRPARMFVRGGKVDNEKVIDEFYAYRNSRNFSEYRDF